MIPEDHRKLALAVLRLLAVSFRPLTVEEVAEAIAVDCGVRMEILTLSSTDRVTHITSSKVFSGLCYDTTRFVLPIFAVYLTFSKGKQELRFLLFLSKGIPRVGSNLFEFQESSKSLLPELPSSIYCHCMKPCPSRPGRIFVSSLYILDTPHNIGLSIFMPANRKDN